MLRFNFAAISPGPYFGPCEGTVDSLSLLLVLLSIAALYVASQALYRIFLHPLAAVPGPLIGKLSSAYIISAQAKFLRAQTLRSLHDRYGPVVRIGPNEVSVSEPSAYRDIYNVKASVKTESFYRATSLAGHESSFTLRDRDQHQARRKLQGPSFSATAIARNEELIVARADVLVQRMLNAARDSSTGSTADAFRFCGLYTLEVFLKHSFNRDYGDAPDGPALQLLKAMDSSAEANRIVATLPFMTRRIGKYIPGPTGHSFREWDLWQDLTSKLLDDFKEHEVDLDKEERFLATPAIIQDDTYLGRTLTHDELIEEFMSLTFAGSGTTSTTLAYLIFELANDPSLQNRLRDELNTVDGSLTALRRLPLLNAVIKETFRLYPSIISTLPRMLTRALDIHGFTLPPGTEIGMQNYVHQRDARIFPHPDEFLPDRWSVKEDERVILDHALTPFSLGYRNCVGQNLAWAELYIGVSRIFTKLKLSLSDLTKPDDMEMQDRFNMAPVKKSLYINLEPLS